jgi:hypothetical protein
LAAGIEVRLKNPLERMIRGITLAIGIDGQNRFEGLNWKRFREARSRRRRGFLSKRSGPDRGDERRLA